MGIKLKGIKGKRKGKNAKKVKKKKVWKKEEEKNHKIHNWPNRASSCCWRPSSCKCLLQDTVPSVSLLIHHLWAHRLRRRGGQSPRSYGHCDLFFPFFLTFDFWLLDFLTFFAFCSLFFPCLVCRCCMTWQPLRLAPRCLLCAVRLESSRENKVSNLLRAFCFSLTFSTNHNEFQPVIFHNKKRCIHVSMHPCTCYRYMYHDLFPRCMISNAFAHCTCRLFHCGRRV